MKGWHGLRQFRRVAGALACLLVAARLPAQDRAGANERVFPQSKAAVEATLKAMQAGMAGRLPVLEGFAIATEHPLDRYQRGYYQANAQVTEAPAGGSWVRISLKVTAWYSDPAAAHSGYQLLRSNGRLEADLLDQLAEQLAQSSKAPRDPPHPAPPSLPAAETAPAIFAPSAKPEDAGPFTSALSKGLTPPELGKPPANQSSALETEADGLQEILKSQAHPRNLVAVKKSGTPVVGSPSLTAKPLFLASMHDEFEMLDFNADWVHVRISGLSRGWIWRNSLEMPDGISDTATHAAPLIGPAADLFHVTREEAAQFPGDWQPLRGKNVKIISIEKVDENAKNGSAQDKLEYAKYLLEKTYADMVQKQPDLAGIVLIFDAADGGMIAATAATLEQWKSGTLSDSALWHNCFFDPPEIFNPSSSSGTQ